MSFARIGMLFGFLAIACAADPDIRVALDARELPDGGLLRAKLTIPLTNTGTTLTLCYPQWIPGTHAPSGPIQNLAGLKVHDDHGTLATWNRDPRDVYRVVIDIPKGASSIVIDLAYIANQPTTNSIGVDVVGTPDFGLISWNCCLLLPEAASIAHLTCAASIELPPEWVFASALHRAESNGTTIEFDPLPVENLIDSPVLIGKKLDRFRLHATDTNGPEVMLHVAASADQDPWRDEHWLTSLRRLPVEAQALFGGAWYPRYDFLLILGDDTLGVEHTNSSLSGMNAQACTFSVADASDREILAHEYTHSWVGKYRRPAGMLVDNYQTPPVHDSLWVYEGLTEYLGRVLAVRSGLMTPDEWRAALAENFHDYAAKPGRHWRSLRDTCRSSYLLRDFSAHHPNDRRDQDYYEEGALFWLAADLRLRAATHGAKSLDDFCSTFFGPTGQHAPGYTETELIAALNAIYPDEWAAMIHHWIDETNELDPALFNGCGWQLTTSPAKPGEILLQTIRPTAIREAIGILVIDGWITEMDDGSPAAEAGLLVGDFIHSANGSELEKNPSALGKAVLMSPVAKKITVKSCRDRTVWTDRTIVYANGLRGTRLVRQNDELDVLTKIGTPRTATTPTPAIAEPTP